MSSRERNLDEKEYILLDDFNIRKYGLNHKNLYSYDKKIKDEIEIIQVKKSNKTSVLYKLLSSVIKINGGDITKLTTYSEKPNPDEIKKMTDFINIFSPLCVHIPFSFNDKTYYIEYTAKKKHGTKTEKIIISICLDREHTEEIIHITCFPHSYIHLTFIINEKHYKIYQKYNPNSFNDILEFVMNCKELFDILITNKKSFNIEVWSNSKTNNWREEVITNNDNKELLYTQSLRWKVQKPSTPT